MMRHSIKAIMAAMIFASACSTTEVGSRTVQDSETAASTNKPNAANIATAVGAAGITLVVIYAAVGLVVYSALDS